MNNGITIGVVKKSGGNDSTKFPTKLLGYITNINSFDDILNNTNLVVEKGESPILIVTEKPSKSNTQVSTKHYLWKLGSGNFSPIGSNDIQSKLELINEKFLGTTEILEIINNPTAQEIPLGVIQEDFITYMNNNGSYGLTDNKKTYIITFTKDSIDYAYIFQGLLGIYGVGFPDLNIEDFIFIYQSTNSGNTVDNSVITLSTYEDLFSLINSRNLIPGATYKFPYRSTNFVHGQNIVNRQFKTPDNNQSIEFQNNFDDVHIGEEEILIAQAISTFQLSPTVYSEKYQQDIIEYMPYVDKLGVDMYAYTGHTMSDNSYVLDFNLKWDVEKQQVYFQMPNGYPINYGHFLYLYCEFQKITESPLTGGEIVNFVFNGFGANDAILSGWGFGVKDIDYLGDKPEGYKEIIWNPVIEGFGRGLVLEVEVVSGALLQLRPYIVNNAALCGTNFSDGDIIHFYFDSESYSIEISIENDIQEYFTPFPAIYVNENGYTTGGEGSGATFFVSQYFDRGVPDSYSIGLIEPGSGYQNGDTVLFPYKNIATNEFFEFNIIEATPIEGGTIVEDYYQDGFYEPLMLGINNIKRSYLQENPFKELTRLEISQDRTRVYLIDLDYEDYENYVSDTLYIDHIEAIVDCQGWITKREDTQFKISMPLDWRNFMYRRWFTDPLDIIAGYEPGYYGLTSKDNNLLSTSNQWKDFPIYNKTKDFQNVVVGGDSGPNEYYLGGCTSNFIFTNRVVNVHFNLGLKNSTFKDLINVNFNGKVENLTSSGIYDSTIGNIRGFLVGAYIENNIANQCEITMMNTSSDYAARLYKRHINDDGEYVITQIFPTPAGIR